MAALKRNAAKITMNNPLLIYLLLLAMTTAEAFRANGSMKQNGEAQSGATAASRDPAQVEGSRSAPTIFNVRDYGAVGDEKTDDTSAIQAAINAADTNGGGTVYLPAGSYRITGIMLGINNTGDATSFVSLVGESEITTKLRYYGSSSGVALSFNKNKYSHLRDLRITNCTGSRGSTEGIRTAGSSHGTASNGHVFESLIIEGFHYGWHTSSSDEKSHSTSSEITAINLQLEKCDSGFRNNDFNGLNFNFINLSISECAIGVDAVTAGVYVHGGAAAGNGIDFFFANGGTRSVSDFRSETCRTFLEFNPGSNNAPMSVTNCQVTAPKGEYAIKMKYGKLLIESSQIEGPIQVGGGCDISIINSKVCDKVLFHTSSPAYGTRYRVVGSSTCTDINSPARVPDSEGVVDGSSVNIDPKTGAVSIGKIAVADSESLKGASPNPLSNNGAAISMLRHGTVTLVSGVATVKDALVTSNSRIFAQRQTDGGTVGCSYSLARMPGESFTITAKDSSGARQDGDTSVIAYEVIEP
jgi:hypothetical protein